MVIKSKDEIAKYLKDQMGKQGLKQAALADRMLEIVGENAFSKNQLTDNISKWLKGERYPGTEYLFYLSQALKVTIENILTTGECNEKYDDRVTLYTIAKDKNLTLIDKFMHQNEEVFTNYDEFDKTLIDYAIEFRNINLIKYLFDKKIIRFDNQMLISPFRVALYNGTERFYAILEMIIENDELDYFKMIINKSIVVNRHSDECESRKIILTDEVLNKIFSAPNILNYLIKDYVPSKEEWDFYNQWITPKDGRIKQLKTLSGWFNEILRNAIQNENYELSEKLLTIGINHNNEILEVFKNANYLIDEDFCLKSIMCDYECVNILAGYNGNIVPTRLRQKIQELNKSMEICGRRIK